MHNLWLAYQLREEGSEVFNAADVVDSIESPLFKVNPVDATLAIFARLLHYILNSVVEGFEDFLNILALARVDEDVVGGVVIKQVLVSEGRVVSKLATEHVVVLRLSRHGRF